MVNLAILVVTDSFNLLLSAILLVGVIGKFMAELGELTVLFEAGLGCPTCM